jgi:hypothetical protein
MFTYTSDTTINQDLVLELSIAADVLFATPDPAPTTQILDALCEDTPYADDLVATCAALTARMLTHVSADNENDTRGAVSDSVIDAVMNRAWDADEEDLALAKSLALAITADEPIAPNAPALRMLVKVTLTLSAALAVGLGLSAPGDMIRTMSSHT